jgi:signal transduction histidine kinase
VAVDTSGQDFQVYADEDRMRQILVNLVSNAIKFSPKGSTVTLRTVETPQWAEFRIEDRGRGIPEHLIPVIFERFRQTQISDSKEKGGSGLGLAICKALVELHEGEIAVDSVVNQGTTFAVRVPRTGQRA